MEKEYVENKELTNFFQLFSDKLPFSTVIVYRGLCMKGAHLELLFIQEIERLWKFYHRMSASNLPQVPKATVKRIVASLIQNEGKLGQCPQFIVASFAYYLAVVAYMKSLQYANIRIRTFLREQGEVFRTLPDRKSVV